MHRRECVFVLPNECAAIAMPDSAVTRNYFNWACQHTDDFDIGLCVLSNDYWESVFGEAGKRKSFLHMALHGRPYPFILNTWSHEYPNVAATM